MDILLTILLGFSYFIAWVILFSFNIYLFEKLTPFNVKDEIFEIQNKALGSIVRWQLLWQAIMIWMLIYFLWTNLTNSVTLEYILLTFKDIFIFGVFGIFIFQFSLFLLWKTTSLHKEIIVDNNESLWKIIEWFLIATAIILSVCLYAY